MFTISLGNIHDMLALHANIPEFDHTPTVQDITLRVGANPLLLMAYQDAQPVAYKLGYGLEDGSFYSWMGGVHPNFRRFGLAQRLLDAQERHCLEQGFRCIKVKSMNRFPAMMMMLLKNGYHIDGLTANSDTLAHKIHFIKRL